MTTDFNSATTAPLTLSAEDTANLQSGAKWARFLAICSLVAIGLVITFLVVFGGSALAMAGFSSSDSGVSGSESGLLILGGLIYAAIFAVGIYVTWMQYKFSSRAVDATTSGDGAALTESFSALRKMYKVSGIIMAVYLGMIVIALFFSLLGGAAALFMG